MFENNYIFLLTNFSLCMFLLFCTLNFEFLYKTTTKYYSIFKSFIRWHIESKRPKITLNFDDPFIIIVRLILFCLCLSVCLSICVSLQLCFMNKIHVNSFHTRIFIRKITSKYSVIRNVVARNGKVDIFLVLFTTELYRNTPETKMILSVQF